VSVDDLQWERLDPPQRRQQILDGVKRLLLRPEPDSAHRRGIRRQWADVFGSSEFGTFGEGHK